MARRSPLPINVNPLAMFAPADGRLYTEEDYDRAFAQQPFDGPDVPFDYLVPSRTTTLRPPKLVYGWRLGHEILMDIARQHFPRTIMICMGPALLGLVDEETYHFSPESLIEEHENFAATLYSPSFPAAVSKYLGIPLPQDYIVVQNLSDSKGDPALGLVVGTNYIGAIEDEQIEKLQHLITPFAPDERPQWYLDCNYWQWCRVAPARGATKAAARKKVAPATQQPLVTS
ncbi:hypothetical protein C8Q80DRAFT_1271048 [Daedaleopsis nitida]|nr:hypothetical protein C8Q80DRAFT_1271048 [Daedaleopsis nitida]